MQVLNLFISRKSLLWFGTISCLLCRRSWPSWVRHQSIWSLLRRIDTTICIKRTTGAFHIWTGMFRIYLTCTIFNSRVTSFLNLRSAIRQPIWPLSFSSLVKWPNKVRPWRKIWSKWVIVLVTALLKPTKSLTNTTWKGFLAKLIKSIQLNCVYLSCSSVDSSIIV